MYTYIRRPGGPYELLWKFRRKETSFDPAWIRTPDRPARSVVTTLTELLTLFYATKITSGYKYLGEPGSVVGIATGYGLDGPGIESPWWRDFPQLSRPALGPTQPPVQWVPGLFRG